MNQTKWKISQLRIMACADLPTQIGRLEVLCFSDEDGKCLDDIAILPFGKRFNNDLDVHVRIHSECATGEVFGSLRCDCRDQLDTALDKLISGEIDVILYLRQEGRGIGAGNKIRAYELQDQGCDTVQANLRLGFDEDERRYDVASAMIKALSIKSINLHTNNPRKVSGLVDCGIEIVSRIPIMTPLRSENRNYLCTKRQKLGHLF